MTSRLDTLGLGLFYFLQATKTGKIVNKDTKVKEYLHYGFMRQQCYRHKRSVHKYAYQLVNNTKNHCSSTHVDSDKQQITRDIQNVIYTIILQ